MAESHLVPIFPLAEVVLVPSGMLPLHIFEHRYRAMVQHVLAGDRKLAMAMPAEGQLTPEGDIEEKISLGRVVQHRPYPDGRCDIVLQGESRLRVIEELATEHPWRVVRAVPDPDVPGLLDSVPEIFADLITSMLGVDEEQALIHCRQAPAEATNMVLLRLDLTPREKHRILSLPIVGERIDAVARILNRTSGRTLPDTLSEDDPRRN